MRCRFVLLLALGLITGFLVFSGTAPVRAQTETPPEMPPLPQGLDPPPTVYPPTEVSQGSNVYYLVCMACHGDRGQGLTDEWRGMLDPADQNCWQSKCHHSNHPPEGFVFPKYVPPVTGSFVTGRFKNGLELYEYIRSNMPYQAPGSRSEEEYWQLTAFLLSLNGADPGDQPLNPERAARIALGKPAQALNASVPAPTQVEAGGDATRLVLAVGLAMAIIVSILIFIFLKPAK